MRCGNFHPAIPIPIMTRPRCQNAAGWQMKTIVLERFEIELARVVLLLISSISLMVWRAQNITSTSGLVPFRDHAGDGAAASMSSLFK